MGLPPCWKTTSVFGSGEVPEKAVRMIYVLISVSLVDYLSLSVISMSGLL